MPRIIKKILFILIFSILLISCKEKIESGIILVDSIEVSGLHYITTEDLLRDCYVSHKNMIAVDIGKLHASINENMLIKESKVIFNQNKLFVNIGEKQVLAGIGVLVDNRIIPGLLLDDMTALSGYYKLDMPVILSDDNFFLRKDYEADLNDIARLLRKIKKYLPQIYDQISTIKPLMGHKIEVTLIGRNTKFELDISEENIDRLKLFAGYVDMKKYSPSTLNIYGDRAVIK